MLRKFAAFPEIQVIDLDAAIGRGSNGDLVRMIASKAVTRVGGGVRSAERARVCSNRARTGDRRDGGVRTTGREHCASCGACATRWARSG